MKYIKISDAWFLAGNIVSCLVIGIPMLAFCIFGDFICGLFQIVEGTTNTFFTLYREIFTQALIVYIPFHVIGYLYKCKARKEGFKVNRGLCEGDIWLLAFLITNILIVLLELWLNVSIIPLILVVPFLMLRVGWRMFFSITTVVMVLKLIKVYL